MDDFEGPYRCALCWAMFDSPAELADHEQGEEHTLFVLDGENVVVGTDGQEPST